ncbi:primosomal protein N' [Streptomyces sp. GESEQ-35]|uniref:primosomal protein N' n=1 Tax=Streptomyces sp. GESEQ-35 TaxID=2812657 RepID=UPI001B32ECDF|nr:primosomal protein N' [Streptomyces sp. GESEQ-35]
MSSEDGQGAGGGEGAPPEQLAFIRESVRKAKAPRAKPRTWRGAALATTLPVARVLVDKGVLHLDRYFDYAVPEELDAEAQPGVRVRVRFGAGRNRVRDGRREGGGLIDGFLVERRAESDYSGPLAALAQVVSPEPVLSEELLGLARAVADRYAGSLADVLQLAVPPRSARAEQRPSPEPLPAPGAPEAGSWRRYERGAAFLEALASGGAPRAVWNALPGADAWSGELARAVVATLASGRGALVVLPDGRAVARVDAALTSLLGEGRHAVLTADAGPEKRYREWLAVRRGSVRAVVGTRAAMFAPVQNLGLVAIWDDGDDSHSELHAPQPHAREVLLLRAAQDKCAFLLGGWSCTVEAAQLVESGWAGPLVATREQVRGAAPLVRTVGDGDLARDEAARAARLPTLAWQAVRDALRTGPVLVQVPRRGYVPRMACAQCRAPARCRHCAGPLEAQDAGALRCGWCGREEGAWHCPECGSFRLRAQVVGARRTAEELGRAFPAVAVRTSGREHVLDTVPGAPALVVSTPGAEPVAEGGYAAALLLDGWAMLGRPDLRAGEDALRRWIAAAALVRPQGDGGTVVVVAEPTLRPVQALVRWDPVGHAVRELGERAELGFPPVSRMAAVSGSRDAVGAFLEAVELPREAQVLGPVPLPVTAAGRPRQVGAPPPGEHWERALIRVPPGRGSALAAALKAAQAARMAKGSEEAVRIRIDPPDIG